MIRFIALLGLLFLVGTSPAKAEFSVASVRDALASEDFSSLEMGFQSAYEQALEDRDFAKIRNVYSVLFVTANAARLRHNQKWLMQHPDSPFAATGLAWAHYYRASQILGYQNWWSTTVELQTQFFKELELSKLYTDMALGFAPSFLPAVDAAILLRGTDTYRGDVKPFVQVLLDVAPDRHALEIGLDALSLHGVDNLTNNVLLCANLAERVPSYDDELCFIEVVFKNNATGALRKAAVTALGERTEPFLDYARLDAYLTEWRFEDEARDEAKRIHRATLGPLTGITQYRHDLERIERSFNMPLYEVEGHDRLVLTMQRRLSDNPESFNILNLLIRDILDRHLRRDPTADLGTAREYWLDMLDLGEFRPETWLLGEEVISAADPQIRPERYINFMSNAIYYSRHSPGYIRELMHSLHYRYRLALGEISATGLDIDQKALLEEVKCPMLRAARVYRLVCEQVPDHYGCNIGGWQADLSDRLARIAQQDQQCAWIRLADPEQLYYGPVPTEQFQKGL